jgi:hypothetical protein
MKRAETNPKTNRLATVLSVIHSVFSCQLCVSASTLTPADAMSADLSLLQSTLATITAYETLIVKGANSEVPKARYAVYRAEQTALATGMRLLGLATLEKT